VGTYSSTDPTLEPELDRIEKTIRDSGAD